MIKIKLLIQFDESTQMLLTSKSSSMAFWKNLKSPKHKPVFLLEFTILTNFQPFQIKIINKSTLIPKTYKRCKIHNLEIIKRTEFQTLKNVKWENQITININFTIVIILAKKVFHQTIVWTRFSTKVTFLRTICRQRLEAKSSQIE